MRFDHLLRRFGRATQPEPVSDTAARHQVEVLANALFRLAVDREPSTEERERLLAISAAEGSTGEALIATLIAEWRPGQQLPLQRCFQPDDSASRLSEAAQQLSVRLQSDQSVANDHFERLFEERFLSGRSLVIGQEEYGRQHKERFRELFTACGMLLDGNPAPTVLELGTSEFSAFFHELFPHWRVHLSDRPTAPDYIGFSERTTRRITDCDDYFALDLEGGAEAVAAAGLEPMGYDLVIFTEVLEHLVADPVEVLRALLGLLKEGGFLYLTTPSFFRRENLERLCRLDNPQETYPPSGENWDRHHHHREYGAKEMFRFISEAGGTTAAFYFSACWDADRTLPAEQRANLVFVIQALPSGR